jgi:5'-3' exonuclease
MKTLLLIDLSGIYWANWHATSDKEVSEAFERTVSRVTSLAADYDLVAVCCDAPPYWRKDILPTYKAQRDAPPPQAVEQFRRVKERLEADGFLLWSAQGFEADDVIATAVERAKGDDITVTIASSDKDLMQLASPSVTCFSTMSGVRYTPDQVVAKFGIGPEKMLDLLSLVGDTSDNVPGVPGIGPKTAADLLKRFGDLDGVLAEVAKPLPQSDADEGGSAITKPKLRASLIEHADAALLARRVITLRTDVPINFEEIYMEREQKPLAEDIGDVDEPEGDSGPRAAPPQPTAPVVQDAEYEPVTKGGTSALATVSAPEWSLALEPSSLGAAHKFAKYLHSSRLYARLPNPEAIWAIIVRGREMGMGAMASLDNFHLVEGRPAPHAHLLVARAMKHPDCEYFRFVGGDDTYAEYETKNRNNPAPTRLKYTIEQAQRAGLCPESPRPRPQAGAKDSRGNWEKRPDEMLRKTCAVQLARIEYPDATQGLYSIEELEGAAA